MSIDLGRRLIAAGLVSPEEVEAAIFVSVVRGLPLARVLLDRGAVTERGLEEELERASGLGMRQVAGAPDLVARLPRAICRRLAALPTRVDPATGAIEVAAADPLDPHVGAEIGFHLGAPIRVLRAPIAAVEEAIRRLELDEPDAPERVRVRRATPASPYGAPQSSIPPPVLDEAPIPLVRKASGAEPRAEQRAEQRAEPRPEPPTATRGGTLVPPAGAPPIGGVALPGPRPPVSIPQPPPTAPYPGLEGRDPSAVSFPSTPPAGDRITPPYGTPAYGAAPQAAPGYRIAPPADDPLPKLRATPEPPSPSPPPPSPSPPPAKPTLMSPRFEASSGPAPAPRRPARPSLGELPYPAAIPSNPVTPGSTRGALPDEEDDGAEPPPVAKAARAPDAGPVLEALARAGSRDDVIRVALRGMRLVARRFAVFAVKRDGFYGWACNVAFGDAEALREVRIPAEQPSVLATATATAIYLGPVPATPAHEALLQVMERASPDVAAVAVRLSGRAALILLADDLEDTLIATRFLGELSHAVGDALARLIVR